MSCRVYAKTWDELKGFGKVLHVHRYYCLCASDVQSHRWLNRLNTHWRLLLTFQSSLCLSRYHPPLELIFQSIRGFNTENSGWHIVSRGTNHACMDVFSWDRCIKHNAAARIFLPSPISGLLSSIHFNMYVTDWMKGSIQISLCRKSLLFNSLQPHIMQDSREERYVKLFVQIALKTSLTSTFTEDSCIKI